MKRLLAALILVGAVTLFAGEALAAPTTDDVWRMLGVDPSNAPGLDSFADRVLFAFASAIRTLSVLSIPIAVIGVLVGALVWGVGSLSHNERVQKGGVVTMLSMLALPVLAKLAPLFVASFAKAF